jgi:Tfp pilus assembly protein PilF
VLTLRAGGRSALSVGGNGAHRPESPSLMYLFAQPLVLAFLTVIFSNLCANPIAYGLDNQEGSAAHADQGLQSANAGDLAGAEVELRKAVQLAPNNSRFLADLGTVLAMEKKLEDSTSIFERALKLDQRDATVRRYLAANLWQLHRYREAKENLEIILKDHPDDKQSRLLLGMVAENMKDYATALRMLASVPAEVQKQPESIAALARSYYHFDQKEKARSMLAILVTHSAEAKGVLLGAQIADEAGDYSTAEKLLTSIESNFPDRATLGYRLALVQYHERQFEQGQQTLLNLIAAGYRTGQILNLLGWCYQKQNESEKAVQALEEAVNLAPSEDSNYLDLVQILALRGPLSAALDAAKRASAALPDSPRIFLTRGSIELKMSQFTDAVASYTRAVQLDPAVADGLLGLAEAEYAAGMKKGARAGFESGMNKFPRDARFKMQFALMLLKEAETGDSADTARAEQLLRSALVFDHSLPEAHHQLGDLALKRGHAAEALEEFKQAANLDPKSARACYALARVYRRLGRTEEASQQMELYRKLKEAETGPTSSPAGISQNSSAHDSQDF